MKGLLTALILLIAGQAVASDEGVAKLIAQGHLAISSSIAPETGAVPGQKLSLTIEVATDSWFSGGTRIKVPEVQGLVILQTGQFAANATERRNGATWVVQRWTLDVYPQQAGEFTVGPIALDIQVGGNQGNTSGGTYSPPVSFSVVIPQALAEADFWVAAPQFTAEQSFDRALEGLVPGDAFEHTITFEGSDTMAMMLPAFSADPQPGLAAYPAPPVLDNYNNRGEVRARRVDTISYVVEAPGNYRLPEQEFFWWDTISAELRLVSLPATDIVVAGGVTAETVKGPEQRSPINWVPVGASLLLLAAMAALLLRYRPWRWLGFMVAPARKYWQLLQSLRRPALPRRLNPGSSAGE